MALNTSGLTELLSDLQRLALSFESDSKAVSQALREGAVPIEQKMRDNASRDPKIITGALHDSIHTGSVKNRRDGGKRITIGVHRKEHKAYYATPVEFGHGGPAPAPPHPFIRPAFDTEKETAYQAMKTVLQNALNRR